MGCALRLNINYPEFGRYHHTCSCQSTFINRFLCQRSLGLDSDFLVVMSVKKRQ